MYLARCLVFCLSYPPTHLPTCLPTSLPACPPPPPHLPHPPTRVVCGGGAGVRGCGWCCICGRCGCECVCVCVDGRCECTSVAVLSSVFMTFDFKYPRDYLSVKTEHKVLRKICMALHRDSCAKLFQGYFAKALCRFQGFWVLMGLEQKP